MAVGFVVRKYWKVPVSNKEEAKRGGHIPHSKVVSPPYSSRSAAEVYKGLAEKDAERNKIKGEYDVAFSVVDLSEERRR